MNRPAPTPRILPLLFVAACLSESGCTNTLNRAIYREKPEAVAQFLSAGADVNVADDEGGTPLIYAAQFGDLALMKTLVARGAKVGPLDRKGNSALSYLASGPAYKNEAVAFLIAQKAPLQIVNDEGRMPLHLAAMRTCSPADAPHQTELLRLLVQAGADPDAAPNGELPLHLAAYAGQPDESLAFLLTVTREPRALTRRGFSAFSEAARGDQRGAEAFFAEHGFEPQDLPPPPSTGAAEIPDGRPESAVAARGYETFGDLLLRRGRTADALASYGKSAARYRAAVAGSQTAVNYYGSLLEEAKSKRRSRWTKAIALSVVGAGLAAGTGVGFAVVPKKTETRIDDYEEKLESHQAELALLLREQSTLDEKIRKSEPAVAKDSPARQGSPPAATHAGPTG
ncbi:MAG: hypothetical protein JWM88_2782 [Verrucomicrobia bacterium]|nr:hypothetical protein [Verrucomicrobiota bacterium]